MSLMDSVVYTLDMCQSLALGLLQEYRSECLMYLVFMFGFLGCRLLATRRLPTVKSKLPEDPAEPAQPVEGVSCEADRSQAAAKPQRPWHKLAPLMVPPRGLSPRQERQLPADLPPSPPDREGEARPPPPEAAPPPPPAGLPSCQGGPQTAAHYSALIQAAGRVGNAHEALRLLGELERQLPGATDTNAWNCALEACVVGGSHAAAQQLLVRMVRSGRADTVSYNTYLKAVLTKGDQKEAEMLLEEMRRSGNAPSTATFNSMIKDAVARMDMQRAWQTIDDMDKADVRPDTITCSVLLRGVKHSACPEDVDRLFEFVQRAELPPDPVLLGALVEAGSRSRDPDRLARLLDLLRPSSLARSVGGQGALIKAYGQARYIEGAWAVWREFSATCASCPEELAHGRAVSTAMVEACLACDDLEAAAAVFREVQDYMPEFPPAPYALGSFVRACLRHQNPQLAVNTYEEVKDELECDQSSYTALADAFVRQRRMDQATGLLRDMARKGVCPDAGVFCLLVRGHCSRGGLEEALQTLAQARRRGVSLDAPLYQTVLEACARKQMRTLSEQVLQDMQRAGIRPSTNALLTMARLYGNIGDVDAAFAVVDEFVERYELEPHELGAKLYECLLSVSVASDDLTRALDVRDRMAAMGHIEDARVHQALVNLCERRGDTASAERLKAAAGMAGGSEPAPVPASVFVDLSSLKQMPKVDDE